MRGKKKTVVKLIPTPGSGVDVAINAVRRRIRPGEKWYLSDLCRHLWRNNTNSLRSHFSSRQTLYAAIQYGAQRYGSLHIHYDEEPFGIWPTRITVSRG